MRTLRRQLTLLAPLMLCLVLESCSLVWVEDTPFTVNAHAKSECYAVYSSLYQNGNSFEPGEVVGIAADIAAPFQEDYCLKPRTTEEKVMTDAAHRLAKYVGRYHPEWDRNFDLGREYRLVPESDEKLALVCISICVNREKECTRPECAPYMKMRRLRRLSIPVFNADHTRAQVLIDRECGGLCGEGRMLILRRTSRGWQEEPNSFALCSWMY